MTDQSSACKPVIVARSLMKTFLSGRMTVRALRGASADVFPRQVTLLRGPSGSGKTTLLSVFGCILTPDAGDLHICGEDVRGLEECEIEAVRRQKVGFVFQSFNLFPTLRAWENIAVALDLHGVPYGRAKARALEALEKVGLADRSDAMPGELSGGQNQRVAIARAIVGNPTILLADEPTAALDTENGRSVMGLLRNLAVSDGRAIVVVTHDERVVEFCDRVITMKDGTIVGDAPIAGRARARGRHGDDLPRGGQELEIGSLCTGTDPRWAGMHQA
jgi:putative ABC transport system ATP-binding protein